METYTCTTLEELAVIADSVLAVAQSLAPTGATVITLTGDLGAGKTALTKIIATKLGIADVVTSPTFVVMKEYEMELEQWSRLIHIDAYRIETNDELAPLKMAEVLADHTNLVLIEWPEQMAEAIPASHVAVTLVLNPDDTRTITITPHHG
jgi:tRNA threonylcarbamoyladenosine biosynthesis protein TsaE